MHNVDATGRKVAIGMADIIKLFYLAQIKIREKAGIIGSNWLNQSHINCAFAIFCNILRCRGALTGSKIFPAKFANTCWSLINTDDGVKVGATYKATDEKIAKVDGFISKTGETADIRKQTYLESEDWYTGITSDMFG